MDLSAINNTFVDSTLQSAKFSKQEKSVKAFEDALNNASKVANETKAEEDDKALKEMCDEFEKYFLKEMYKSMKKTVNYDNYLIYGGQSEEIFSDFLDEQYVDGAVKAGGIGLSKKLYEQLKSPYSATGSKMINEAKASEEASDSSDVKVTDANDVK